MLMLPYDRREAAFSLFSHTLPFYKIFIFIYLADQVLVAACGIFLLGHVGSST